MVYVMSDIHGCRDKYNQMLEKIRLGDGDTLYVLGDVVDRGDDPMGVLRDMRERPNVRPIMGNHDYVALLLLRQVLGQKRIDSELWEDLRLWFSDGGLTTFEGFLDLPEQEREGIAQYMSTFAPYKAVSVNGEKYILTHAGLPRGSKADSLSGFSVRDFITAKTDYGKQYFADRFLVTGHVPTFLIKENHKGVYRAHNHIAIDNGAVYGGRLACLCLDTGGEFYT